MESTETANHQLTVVQNECTRLLLENRELRRLQSQSVMYRVMNDVAAFHGKFDVPINTRPRIPPRPRCQLRYNLISEECKELLDAITQDDLVEIADGIADLIYVAIGTALEYGIPLAQVWDEVQRTNMAKVGGEKNGIGKILKPIGWQPPKIAEILEAAK